MLVCKLHLSWLIIKTFARTDAQMHSSGSLKTLARWKLPGANVEKEPLDKYSVGLCGAAALVVSSVPYVWSACLHS